MLRSESSPGVQPGCGSRLAWHRFRGFSNRCGRATNVATFTFRCASGFPRINKTGH